MRIKTNAPAVDALVFRTIRFTRRNLDGMFLNPSGPGFVDHTGTPTLHPLDLYEPVAAVILVGEDGRVHDAGLQGADQFPDGFVADLPDLVGFVEAGFPLSVEAIRLAIPSIRLMPAEDLLVLLEAAERDGVPVGGIVKNADPQEVARFGREYYDEHLRLSGYANGQRVGGAISFVSGVDDE